MRNYTIIIIAILFLHTSIIAQFDWEFLQGTLGAQNVEMRRDKSGIYLFAENVMLFSDDDEEWEKQRIPKYEIISVGDGMIISASGREEYQVNVSANKGKSWETYLLSPTIPSEIRSVQVTEEGMLVVTGNSELHYRKHDEQHWSILQKRPGSIGVLETVLVRDSLMYKDFFNNQLNLTRLGSNSWSTIPLPDQLNMSRIRSLAVTPSGICVMYDEEFCHVDHQGVATIFSKTSKEYGLKDGHYGNHLKFVDQDVVYESSDGGLTWDTNSYEVTDSDDQTIDQVMSPSGEIYIMTKILGLHRLDNFSRLRYPYIDGISLGQVNDYYVSNDKIWLATNLGLQTYDLITKKWDTPTDLDLLRSYKLVCAEDNLVVTISEDQLYYSLDGGETFDVSELDGTYLNYEPRDCHVFEHHALIKTNNGLSLFDMFTRSYEPFSLSAYKSPSKRMFRYNDRTYFMSSTNSLRHRGRSEKVWYHWKFGSTVLDIVAFEGDMIGVNMRDSLSTEGRLLRSYRQSNWEIIGFGLPYHPINYDFPFEIFRIGQTHYIKWYDHNIYASYDNMVNWELAVLDECAEDYSYIYTNDGVFRTWHGMESIKLHTSTNQVKSDHLLQVYPNPATHRVTVKLEGPDINDQIVLVNGQGQSVLRRMVHNQSEVTIDLNGVPTGLYYVLIYGKGRMVHSSKLVVSGD